jgi:sugar phosphate isomerase/epimerase
MGQGLGRCRRAAVELSFCSPTRDSRAPNRSRTPLPAQAEAGWHLGALPLLGAHHRLDWESLRCGPFIPADVAKKSPEGIEQWAEDYTLKLLDLCVELNVKILPMFWGVAFGWEVATGYPWGFWSGGDFDLIKEGKERFVKKTEKIRAHANQLGIYLAHEIHPGTAAMCADDFLMLVDACGGDKCLGVNADPSHCWEGEDWETRFLKWRRASTRVM